MTNMHRQTNHALIIVFTFPSVLWLGVRKNIQLLGCFPCGILVQSARLNLREIVYVLDYIYYVLYPCCYNFSPLVFWLICDAFSALTVFDVTERMQPK